MTKIIKWIATQPFIIGLAVLGLILFIVSPDDLTFIRDSVGGGLIIKIINALIAGLILMALVKIAMLMRVLFADGKPNGIFKDPVAKAVLMSGIYIAMAVVVSTSFG